MNMKNMFLAAVAMLCLVSCASETTKISGVVSDTEITDVRVTLSSAELDTLVAVVDGKFSIDVPTDEQSYGMIIMMVENQGKYGSYYIPDGYPINITVEEDIVVSSEGKGPESAYVAFVEAANKIFETESETQEADFVTLCCETVKANPGNAIALLALSQAVYYMTPEQKLEIVDYIQEPFKSNEFITSVMTSAKAQMDTREGMMFTDFTVEHVYGYDRSVDPQPLKKEVKFSDYVGKGTYVLVDFWSPWCGPCRREIPNIQKVYEQYKDKGLQVLSLAVWERKPQSHTIETAAELGMDWLHINNCGTIPTDIYGVDGIPHLMLIGPDGTILKRGFHGLEGIQAAVAEYIK